jgi:hypothetical protein
MVNVRESRCGIYCKALSNFRLRLYRYGCEIACDELQDGTLCRMLGISNHLVGALCGEVPHIAQHLIEREHAYDELLSRCFRCEVV